MLCHNTLESWRLARSLGMLALLAASCHHDDTHDTGSLMASDAAAPDAEATVPADGLHVMTGLGMLEGKLVDATREFLGIPYAAPPVGDLRFQPPQPMAAWSETRPALDFGHSCPQPMSALSSTNPSDEDCLYLNVYTPDVVDGHLPVMVYIHGGAFMRGASDQFDGAVLSQAWSVVVVTLNYRLGALGFLAHPALDAARSVPSGDDGIRDQQLALQFVHDNIAAFGGDPQNVTVFGNSAGSVSACIHFVAPASRGLAQRFIMESGTCVGGGYGLLTQPAAQALGQQLSDGLCSGEDDVLGCLRDQPLDALVNWQSTRSVLGNDWGPTVDGDNGVLPDSPENLLADPAFAPVPVIVGTNKNEWGLFAVLSTLVVSRDMLHDKITQQFGDRAADVEAQYHADKDAQAYDVYTRLMTDIMFRCPTRSFARTASAAGAPIYLYSFEQGTAVHGQELDFVFGSGVASAALASEWPLLTLAVQDYWTEFSRTGAPNRAPLPVWPAYDASADQSVCLADPIKIVTGLSQSDCDFWEQFVGSGGTIQFGF